MPDTRVSAEVNWPLVAGVVVVAGVAVYILYAVNSILQNAESALSTALGDIQNPISALENLLGIGNNS
jgi:hypothetical protein